MKHPRTLLGALFAGLAGASHGIVAAADACVAASPRTVVPVIELYTSEGCNSCPPADRWLSALIAREDASVVALGYHVDYWDDLGWVDRFASPGNSVRQRLRAQDSQRDIVYTPQVMLGDDVQVDWRDTQAVTRATTAARESSPPLRLAVEAVPEAGGWRVTLDARALDSAIDGARRIELALYADGLKSSVTAGENRRLQLTHDRVVRVLAGPWSVAADKPLHVEASMRRPVDEASGWGVVAIVHASDSLSPRWGVHMPLANCGDRQARSDARGADVCDRGHLH